MFIKNKMMKTKLFVLMAFALATFSFYSCGSDDEETEAIITDEELLGSWVIIDGYETDGSQKVTSSVGYTVTLNANGTGEIGPASIKWSRSGNRFTYSYSSSYYTSSVFSGKFSYSNGTLTMTGTGNGWTFEYKLRKTGDYISPTLVGIWKCTSSTSTYKGNTYTDVLKGETLTINSDGTFTSTTSYIGKSGTWSQKDNTLYVSSNDGGNIVLDFTLSASKLDVRGSNDSGETFNCTFTKE